ncbi:DEAD/DEAH box helicase [Haliangium ochraceum]|uniref:SNF2-related protein n=1 Tax=Haliangium ochraceum (strain DSM 14365 / JCM 11303 / SMP-2) TaxID=502025 RepID=D0LJV1_HALO1|nr:DEAD/DEAH box helicase [Haliangium ochraceum]ACY18458.1 SNF2-related protein [Haliangium ochraceum DSM 14365]
MLVILHAGVVGGRFLLWGERLLDDELRRAGRRPLAGDGYSPHPFAARWEQLVRALDAAGVLVTVRDAATATVWLPSRGAMPLPSHPVLGEPPSMSTSTRSRSALVGWRVPCAVLAPVAAVTLLRACAERAMLDRGVVIGSDLTFWGRVLRLVGAAVAGQRFVPDLRLDGEHARAVWSFAPNAGDLRSLALLARAMPPVARALRAFGDGDAALAFGTASAPAVPAGELLGGVVAGLLDHLVREGVDGVDASVLVPAADSSSERPASVSAARARQGRASRAAAAAAAAAAVAEADWLRALCGSERESRFAARAEVLRDLGRRVRAWRMPLARVWTAPLRLCLRLDEPVIVGHPALRPSAGDDALWQVSYFVQVDDEKKATSSGSASSSRAVPARSVWSGRGRGAAELAATGIDPAGFLRAALECAARLCPAIALSLDAPMPTGFKLDTRAAYEFLTAAVPRLELAGVRTILPGFWRGSGGKRHLAVRAVVTGTSGVALAEVTLETPVRVRWEVILGAERVRGRELEALAAADAPLVRVRGQWAELSPRELRRALAFWQRKRQQESATLRDVVHMSVGACSPTQERASASAAGPGRARELAFAGVVARGWVAKILATLERRQAIAAVPAPAMLVAALRPYQARGYAWLAFLRQLGCGACLADDMGLGKTLQVLALVARERERGETRATLVVAPPSVLRHWQREAARFLPGLRVYLHRGGDRARGRRLAERVAECDVLVTSYALVHRDLAHLRPLSWAGVILDEAQQIARPEAKQTRALCALSAAYRIALVGLPVENEPRALWSLMSFLNPGLLGDWPAFRAAFALPIATRRDAQAAERLRRVLQPFVLRRQRTDLSVLGDLPDAHEMRAFCYLGRAQAARYRAVLAALQRGLAALSPGRARTRLILDAVSELKLVCAHLDLMDDDGGEAGAGAKAATSQRVKKSNSDRATATVGRRPSLAARSAKLARVLEMVRELVAAGGRCLLVTQHLAFGRLLKRHLEEILGREVSLVHRRLSRRRREAVVMRFQRDTGAEPPALVLAGMREVQSLHLSRATHVLYLDRVWARGVSASKVVRDLRVGRGPGVHVYRVLCAGTFEERLDALFADPEACAELPADAGERWLASLRDDELLELLALREPPPG